jgi:hypothetical protein
VKVRETKVYYDPRKIGEALWPERHNIERLTDIKTDSPIEFDALYQQEPKAPTELLVYTNWEEVDAMPNEFTKFYGGDLGQVNDPFTLVEMELHKNYLYIDELECDPVKGHYGLVNSEIKGVFERLKIMKKRSWLDSHGQQGMTIRELQILGLNVLPSVSKAVITGVSKIRGLKLRVTKRSHNIKRELLNYQFIAYEGKPTNDILQNGNDHWLDGVRYGYEGYTSAPKIKV